MYSRLSKLSRLAALAAGCAMAADDAPQWLRDASAAQLPKYPAKVSYVVLLNEERVSVDESGKLVCTERHAVKVLTGEGRGAMRGRKTYLTKSDKIRSLQAWSIAPSGRVKKYGKEDVADIAIADNDIFNEYRVRVVAGTKDFEAGVVFGYESVTDEMTPTAQLRFHFQYSEPAVMTRFAVTPPAEWKASAFTFNHAAVEPTVAGGTYTWQLEQLPFIEPEEASPEASSVSPWLAVTLAPPAGGRSGFARTIESWTDVSKWITDLSDPQSEPNEAIQEKARALIAGKTGDFEKIDALARFAQSVQYVSIQTGIARGGGYKPHAASEVFKKLYGDCKDKANLLRSLLKAAGMTSYPVAIVSGDRMHVKEQWASAQQFNHAILAIAVSPAFDQPAVTKHATLGSLLLFDPTDSVTPLGQLPWHEQDSWALVAAGDKGGLIRTPAATPRAADWDRQVTASLTPTGGVHASVTEKRTGQAATDSRSLLKAVKKEDFDRYIQRWIANSVPGAKVEKLETAERAGGALDLGFEFTAERYAQVPNSKLMLFRPAVVRHPDRLLFTEKIRKLPVVLKSQAYQERVSVKIPEGFKVDEIPDAIKLSTPYGAYEAKWAFKDGAIEFTRRLESKALTVPPEEYPAMKKFFDAVNAGAEQPAVLVRQ